MIGVNNAKFFYARVSSKDQSLERQIAAAKELEIAEEYIFIERVGKTLNGQNIS
jgi:predicted site-specific integrase-resolvase